MDPLLTQDDITVEPDLGTRFWIFPQAPFLSGYERPERVWLPIPPDEIGPGPSDARMYVVDPEFDKAPYGAEFLPPFEGPRRPPAFAGPDRHFDHYDPESRAFLPVHAYACVHYILGVWESYLGHPVRWFFDDVFKRLEIVSLVEWDNAQAGYGFLELGRSDIGGIERPYALNFDTIAHEVGHFVLLSELGMPTDITRQADFFSYSEAVADLISLITFLHFDTAIDRLLRRTEGNLLLQNELNRFAETSPETQIRRATNFRRMSEVTRQPHDRAQPFVGAVFDGVVELYHRELVRLGAASPALVETDLRDIGLDDLDRFGDLTANAYRAQPHLFKSALTAARDTVGGAMARSFAFLGADTMTLAEAADAVIASAKPAEAGILRSNFEWREILNHW